MTTYGTLLRRYRERARLSQNALAQRTGHDASYLNRLESGDRGIPSYEIALCLARELAHSAEELDRLVFAAGYVPPRLRRLGPNDRTVAAVLAVLTDDQLSLEALADFRAIVETVAGRWARDARDGSTAPRWLLASLSEDRRNGTGHGG